MVQKGTQVLLDTKILHTRQACKVAIMCVGAFVGGVGGMKEIKVREYGGWTSYTYMK
jgi:hypothetical protein